MTLASLGPFLRDSFQQVQSEDGECEAMCLTLAQVGLLDKLAQADQGQQMEEGLPLALKWVVVQLLLKQSFDSTMLDNYWPVSILLIWGRVIEQVVASQLQRIFDHFSN